MHQEPSASAESSAQLRIAHTDDDIVRADDVPVLSCENGQWSGHRPKVKHSTYVTTPRCCTCGIFLRPEKWRVGAVLVFGIVLMFLALGLIVAGSLKLNQCKGVSTVQLKHPLGTSTVQINDTFFTIKQLTALNNFAFQKPTVQSSTDSTIENTPEIDGVSAMAVDGNVETCSRTDAERDPRWQVDLGGVEPIGSIRIASSNTSILHDFDVYLGEDTDTSAKKLCYHHNGPVRQHHARIVCDEESSGRFVSIVLRASALNKLENLVLCEVMVFGR
ncbi:uncharacterized protein LOC121374991 [Gigantopelta aegis]|uniref:uncharacterized protein LOC121374991 n=1 Tax=Gigantopelta aegis TaxID=1735272 RepID=UPI001B88C3F4|nr:uncharacterized protein LOC121374991 [Gigantopelta aegis]